MKLKLPNCKRNIGNIDVIIACNAKIGYADVLVLLLVCFSVGQQCTRRNVIVAGPRELQKDMEERCDCRRNNQS